MPAIRAHSSLALNRDLIEWNYWDEKTIQQRGELLFKAAMQVWTGPNRHEHFAKVTGENGVQSSGNRSGLPDDGTVCEFTYAGEDYRGKIVDGQIVVEGFSAPFNTFSGASKAITKTSRNGWNDWYLDSGGGQRVLADDWRKS